MAEKSLKKNAILNILRTGMSVIFPLITFPYSSKILGPSGTGKVGFANSVIAYFAMIAGLGINSYAAREAAKLRDNRTSFNKFSKEILIINLSSTGIAYILFFISLFYIPVLKDYKVLLKIFSITIFFNTIGIEWLYRAMEEFSYITIRSFIFQLLSMTLLFTTVKTENDLNNYALLMVISSTGANLFNFIHSKKYINFFEKTTIEIKKHLKPIFIMFSMSLTASVFTMMDSTMVGFLSNDFQVGYYGASIKLINLIKSLIIAINAVLLPRVSYLYEKDKLKFNELLIKGLQATLFLTIPAVFLLFINGDFIITTFTSKKFEQSIICMKIMSPVIFFSSISLVVDNQIFIPSRREKLNLYALIIGAISDFLLNLILIPKYGAVGACYGTLIAEGLMFLYHIFFLAKYMGKKQFYQNIRIFIIPSLIYILFVIILKMLDLNNSLLILLLSILISFLYLIIIFTSKNCVIKDLLYKRTK